MDLLVRATLGFRKVGRSALGALVAFGLGAHLVLVGGSPGHELEQTIAGAIASALLLLRVVQKLQKNQATYVARDMGLLAAFVLIVVLLRFGGGLDGPWAASLYLLMALIAAVARPLAIAQTALYVVTLEACLRTIALRAPATESMLARTLFLASFALASAVVVRAEVARIRHASRKRLDAELAKIQEDARSYRLLGNSEGKSEDRLERSSALEIQKAVHYALDLLRRTLGLHTAVMLWQNTQGTHLRISELSTESDSIRDAPFPVGDGVLAAVAMNKERVSLSNLRASMKVPYYDGPSPARSLLAIPAVEDGQLRGILALDRTTSEAFTPREEELATQAAHFCVRAIQNERVFVQLERAKVEQGKLYRAAQALGAALSEKDVLDAAVRAAREIASFDLAAVTLFDEATRTHQVVAATSGEGEVDDLVGAKFQHNGGLVSMVVQNKFPLPYKGEYDAARQVVLTRHYPWPKLPSLLVLPLVLHGRPLGTLILGAKRRHAFGDSVRPTLEVLASHLAVSLANARMVHKLETMATTDGLTGLFNKRAMLDEAKKKIEAAARFDRKMSLLIADIDFFKKVNDTFGHDVGDVVIKGLGEILKRQKRTTDMVARFGGEEFVVLCEQTDEKGAMLLAERIREELAKTTFHTEKGPLSVTCSLGVATFPGSGKDWDTLFKAADDALYVSKRSGRDKSTAHVPSRGATETPPPTKRLVG